MGYMKEHLVSKVKSLVSMIYGVVLWLTTLASHCHFQHGLDALILSVARQYLNRVAISIIQFRTKSPPLSSHCLLSSPSSPSSFSSSSSFWSSATGDLIGSESGVYMSSNEETLSGVMEKTMSSTCYINQRKINERIGNKIRREYPPPIPSLARTSSLTSRMPWVLNRQCVDGRLILRKERVKNFEYFEAERKNGRLILNIIPIDDTVMGSYFDGNLEQEKYQFVEEEEEEEEEEGEGGGEGGSDDNNKGAEVENNNESENEGFQF